MPPKEEDIECQVETFGYFPDPDFPYDTVRTANGLSTTICAYEVIIFSPRGSQFEYSIYTDGGLMINYIFGIFLCILGVFVM